MILRLLRTVRFAAVLALLAGVADQAAAGMLNPADFASLGTFPNAAGTYTIEAGSLTGPVARMSGPGGNFTGLVFNNIAIFDFDSITLNAGQTITAFGPLPVALLSRTNMTITGTIDVSGQGAIGGPNGGSSAPPPFPFPGSGPGAGGDGIIDGTAGAGGGGGGGFGGTGGTGALKNFNGAGGSAYGDLAQLLQGGSAGGRGGGHQLGGLSFQGGGGGGAIELGALGGLAINGSIFANGGNPGSGGGGGSGGGILIHAPVVLLDPAGQLSAHGSSGSAGSDGQLAGGGGAGGRVLIATDPGLFSGSLSQIDVFGGAAGGPGAFAGTAGEITYVPQIVYVSVPEPSALMLLSIGGLGSLGYYWHRRRAAQRGWKS